MFNDLKHRYLVLFSHLRVSETSFGTGGVGQLGSQQGEPRKT